MVGAGFLLKVEVVAIIMYHIDSDTRVFPNHPLDSSRSHFPFLPQRRGPFVGGKREKLPVKVLALVEASGLEKTWGRQDSKISIHATIYPCVDPSFTSVHP